MSYLSLLISCICFSRSLSILSLSIVNYSIFVA